MVITVCKCSKCDFQPERRTEYCPECGEKEPWVQEPEYEFDEEDLPISFVYNLTNYDSPLWDAFCKSYFNTSMLNREDIASFPSDFPTMPELHVQIYFYIDKNYNLRGPFIDSDRMRQEMR